MYSRRLKHFFREFCAINFYGNKFENINEQMIIKKDKYTSYRISGSKESNGIINCMGRNIFLIFLKLYL